MLEPSTGLGSVLFKISHLAGRDPDSGQAWTYLYDEGKAPYKTGIAGPEVRLVRSCQWKDLNGLNLDAS